MNNKIYSSVQRIFKKIFDNPKLAIDLDTTPDDIAGWNSLKNVMIIAELEKAFDVSFDLDEVIEMNTVGDICQKIEAKLNK